MHRVRTLSGLRKAPAAPNILPPAFKSFAGWSNHSTTFPLQSTAIETAQQPIYSSGEIILSDDPCFSGEFGDVWKAQWKQEAEIRIVAVKALRPPVDKNDFDKKLCREIQVWKTLQHPNIVPLLGVITNFGPYASAGMVSPWMQNGNLNHFMRIGHIPVRTRLQILCDVAAGLAYLHSKEIIHGDLTGNNVLIDNNQHACLLGFGLSSIHAEFEGTSYWSSTVGGAVRWRAIELLPPVNGDLYEFTPVVTPSCDIYSFGSVMLQALSGNIPYQDIKSDVYVLLTLAHGIQPNRPKDLILTDAYWEFINSCWETTPGSRPTADEVLTALTAFRDREPSCIPPGECLSSAGH